MNKETIESYAKGYSEANRKFASLKSGNEYLYTELVKQAGFQSEVVNKITEFHAKSSRGRFCNY